MKDLIKSIFLVFGLLLIPFACQKDFEPDEDVESHDSRLFFTIDFRTFKNKIAEKNISNSDIYDLISPQTVPIGELQYTTQSESENFVKSIDSTDVLMAEKDGITSYTFKTLTTDMSKTTNYVLAHDDFKIEEFYITYENDGSAKIIDPTSGFEVTTQSNSIWCTIAKPVTLCECADHPVGGCSSEGCPLGFYIAWEISIEYCGGFGIGEGNGGSGYGNGNGEGTGGSSGNSNETGNDLPLDGIKTKEFVDYNNGSVECAVNLVEITSVIDCIIDNSFLEPELYNFLLDPANACTVTDVAIFLGNNSGCTAENEAFLEVILESQNNIDILELEFLYELYLYLDDKPCQATIINDLIANNDTQLLEIIKGNFAFDDNYNIVYENVALPTEIDAYANTVLPTGLNFNSNTTARIQFDNNYLDNASDLSIVMTASHEFVHVYLAFLYSKGTLLQNYPEYIALNNAFVTFQNNSNQETGELLNEEMHNVFDDFLSMISESVYSYATNNNIEGVTEEYCNELVIGSHQYTDAFQDLDQSTKNEYSIIAINENDGTEEAKGTKCE